MQMAENMMIEKSIVPTFSIAPLAKGDGETPSRRFGFPGSTRCVQCALLTKRVVRFAVLLTLRSMFDVPFTCGAVASLQGAADLPQLSPGTGGYMIRAFRTQNMMFESTSASNIDIDRFLLARLAIREETTFIIFVGVIIVLLEPA